MEPSNSLRQLIESLLLRTRKGAIRWTKESPATGILLRFVGKSGSVVIRTDHASSLVWAVVLDAAGDVAESYLNIGKPGGLPALHQLVAAIDDQLDVARRTTDAIRHEVEAVPV